MSAIKEEFEYIGWLRKEKPATIDKAAIFRRVNRPLGKIRPEIIPEMMSVCIDSKLLSPDRANVHTRGAKMAQILIMQGNESLYLVELSGDRLKAFSDAQLGAEAVAFYDAWKEFSLRSAIKANKKWRDGFKGEIEINGGSSAWLMDLPGSKSVDSYQSWLIATSEKTSKDWPMLASAQSDEEKLTAYYIDRARNLGTDAPEEIKAKIRKEIRLAKNAHNRRTKKKHDLNVEILCRWHLLADQTIPAIHKELTEARVECTEKAVERAISRMRLDRAVNRFRPSPDSD